MRDTAVTASAEPATPHACPHLTALTCSHLPRAGPSLWTGGVDPARTRTRPRLLR